MAGRQSLSSSEETALKRRGRRKFMYDFLVGSTCHQASILVRGCCSSQRTEILELRILVLLYTVREDAGIWILPEMCISLLKGLLIHSTWCLVGFSSWIPLRCAVSQPCRGLGLNPVELGAELSALCFCSGTLLWRSLWRVVLKVWCLDQLHMGTLEMQILVLTQTYPNGNREGGSSIRTLFFLYRAFIVSQQKSQCRT